MFWTDIARFLQYFKNLSNSFTNILAILQDCNGVFSKYSSILRCYVGIYPFINYYLFFYLSSVVIYDLFIIFISLSLSLYSVKKSRRHSRCIKESRGKVVKVGGEGRVEVVGRPCTRIEVYGGLPSSRRCWGGQSLIILSLPMERHQGIIYSIIYYPLFYIFLILLSIIHPFIF